MTSDTLHDYDRLVETGFADEQARALVELVSTVSETPPQVVHALDHLAARFDRTDELLEQISGRLDRHDQLFEQVFARLDRHELALQGLVNRLDEHGEMFKDLKARVGSMKTELQGLKGQIYVLDERMKSERRIQRMLVTNLIAIGALLGSMLAVFT